MHWEAEIWCPQRPVLYDDRHGACCRWLDQEGCVTCAVQIIYGSGKTTPISAQFH